MHFALLISFYLQLLCAQSAARCTDRYHFFLCVSYRKSNMCRFLYCINDLSVCVVEHRISSIRFFFSFRKAYVYFFTWGKNKCLISLICPKKKIVLFLLVLGLIERKQSDVIVFRKLCDTVFRFILLRHHLFFFSCVLFFFIWIFGWMIWFTLRRIEPDHSNIPTMQLYAGIIMQLSKTRSVYIFDQWGRFITNIWCVQKKKSKQFGACA